MQLGLDPKNKAMRLQNSDFVTLITAGGEAWSYSSGDSGEHREPEWLE
jgi:hypothetical protein